MENNNQKNSWDAVLYDNKHAFVSKLGQGLVELLAPKKGEHILDLGCGTGDLGNQFHEMGVQVIGIDKSSSMIEKAKRKYPDLSFYVGDATNMTFSNQFDAVFSNAVLHWVRPPEKALQQIQNALKPGGRFVAEFGGEGNVHQIMMETIKQLVQIGVNVSQRQLPWYFPSIGEYTSLMEKVGFYVTFAHHFDRPTPLEGQDGLRNWIMMFMGSLFESLSVEEKEHVLSSIEKGLKSSLYTEKGWFADYKRIRVVGMRDA